MLRDLFSLFPAYAGVIPHVMCPGDIAGPFPRIRGVIRFHKLLKEPLSAFPRIRGGDPYTVTDADGDTLFSPHTRG